MNKRKEKMKAEEEGTRERVQPEKKKKWYAPHKRRFLSKKMTEKK